jgi:transposase-like protein
MSKRRTHSPEFKAKVAMEAISGRKTLQEIAADHAVHPIQVSQWKKQLLEGASDLFTRGKKAQAKDESQAKEAELFQQIGKLQMELEWLKKVSTALMPVNCENWSIMTTLSSRSAVNVSCWGCQDLRCISSRCQCVNPRYGSWPGSMPSTWRIPPPAAVGWCSIWPETVSR